MSEPTGLDEFLSNQGESAGFTATLEPVPDKGSHVKVTPFWEGGGCGCASSFELPKKAIRSVTPTGNYHVCCGKRLQVAVVEFDEAATIPVTDLVEQMRRPQEELHAPTPRAPEHVPPPPAWSRAGGPTPGGPERGFPPPWLTHPQPSQSLPLVGHLCIPGTGCCLQCIEVCTRFCGPTGWDCCAWETRCVVACNGAVIWQNY